MRRLDTKNETPGFMSDAQDPFRMPRINEQTQSDARDRKSDAYDQRQWSSRSHIYASQSCKQSLWSSRTKQAVFMVFTNARVRWLRSEQDYMFIVRDCVSRHQDQRFRISDCMAPETKIKDLGLVIAWHQKPRPVAKIGGYVADATSGFHDQPGCRSDQN